MKTSMTENKPAEKLLFLPNTRLVRVILIAFILLLGLGARLIDLSDPPLDFAATRQLHSLILARGYYYEMEIPSTQALPEAQRQFGIQAADDEVLVEPTIFEHLTAWTYAALGREDFRNLMEVADTMYMKNRRRVAVMRDGKIIGIVREQELFYALCRILLKD